jgi:holo-[acyl-carrier protein] synthase
VSEPASQRLQPQARASRTAPAVGLDLLEIERLERAIERRPRLAARLFTDAERAYAASQARPGQHLAARFCAKEAVTKALGLDALRPLEIEVASSGGPPKVRLHGHAAQRAAELGVAVRISLTHTRSEAAAVAIVDPHG